MLQKFEAVLKDKKQLNHETLFISFKLVSPDKINFQAGQYIILEIPLAENQVARRLYSIASPPTQKDRVELIVKLLPKGIGSQYLKELKIGEKVKLSGPAGMFTLKNTNKPKVFLATSTGIAPIRSILFDYSSKIAGKEQIKLFWGLRKKEDVYLTEELESLKDKINFEYFICLSREESPLSPPFFKGHIQEVMPNNLSNNIIKTADFYICGGRSVVEDLKNFLLNTRVEKERIHFEKF